MHTPEKVTLRSYQMGFGDCFLLSFDYGQEERHVLIDFGSIELPKAKRFRAKPWLERVAQHIENRAGSQLTAVIATHRHADHISGFATNAAGNGPGDIIARCKPKLVIQPWTEHPRAARNAERAPRASAQNAFVASLASMHTISAQVHRLVQDGLRTGRGIYANKQSRRVKQLEFLGRDNIQNVSAVENLMAMAPKSRQVYARHGSKTGLEKLLPGVKVHVLGPPDLSQTAAIRRQRTKDSDEFWMLHHSFWQASARTLTTPLSIQERRGSSNVPAELRWLARKVEAVQLEQTLAIVRALDAQMNNTSLILLFEIGAGAGRKLMLFPGDAQLENWMYALCDAPHAAATRKLLAAVDLYKVGHHGSRNATPKSLWRGFSKTGPSIAKDARLKTVISTLSGKHGSTDRRTEVPRTTLLGELKKMSRLSTTEEMKIKKPDAADLLSDQDFIDVRVL